MNVIRCDDERRSVSDCYQQVNSTSRRVRGHALVFMLLMYHVNMHPRGCDDRK